uniref:Uncharacterized protein n=1 Tax=Arundo donax TaxID=35708 RepID=A0A0A9DGX9_ARUDO
MTKGCRTRWPLQRATSPFTSLTDGKCIVPHGPGDDDQYIEGDLNAWY